MSLATQSELNQLLQTIAQNPVLPEIALGLDRVISCLALLDNPHLKMPKSIHIAGTNGKGSVLANLRAMFEQSGKTVHTYTSPHLVYFNERIIVAGKMVDDELIIDAIHEVMECSNNKIPLTFFEITTIAAFLIFSRISADVLLLEVGMGGRLDATNVVTPIASVITPVSFDHKEFLGDTLSQIAAEKAGIIKLTIPVIVAPQHDDVAAVIKNKADVCSAPLIMHGNDWDFSYDASHLTLNVHNETYTLALPALEGTHQYANSALAYVTALTVANDFGLDLEKTKKAPAQVTWPARLQRLMSSKLLDYLPDGSELWLDGGHNEAASVAIADWIEKQTKPVTLYIGLMNRKDSEAFFSSFLMLQSKICMIHFDDDNAADPQKLAETATKLGLKHVKAYPDIEEALRSENATMAGASIHLICGSLYLAGKILKNYA